MEITINKKTIENYLNDKYDDIKSIIWVAGNLQKSVIDNYPNLQKIYCAINQITSLEPLSNCVNLQKLYFRSNQITSLEPLSNCINLQVLDCSDNQITSLEPLSNYINLQVLDC